MTDKLPRGRPITNQTERILASAEEIAKAIFRAANKKIEQKPKPKKKPN